MSEPNNGRTALFAGGLAAILASTCCLGPLVLITLGSVSYTHLTLPTKA